MSISIGIENIRLNLADRDAQAGYRLHRLEVYNWGTFGRRVWTFKLDGNNALLTGDIGSGKSTLVNAVTTLLIPPQRITYNKAAGAETKERSLRSYVLGFYKSERNETGPTAKPVALRDHNHYSVILGAFQNDGYKLNVTLAQVFWIKDNKGQPARFYVVADRALTIANDFANFGTNINDLKKRLRAMPGVELFESFPPYAAAFCRRFGIEESREDEIQIRLAIDKNGGKRIEQIAAVQNLLTEAGVEKRELELKRETIEMELVSLRQRRSNIPQAQIAVRTALCAALNLPEKDMPFAGELLQVDAAEAAWEGAIERLLHNFGLSLLVPDRHYADVAAWVNHTQLKDRQLVYFRVREGARVVPGSLHTASLVRKISIKPDSPFYAWLEGKLARRFDYACCDTLGEFRREKRALTRAGQVKGGERHEKDDRRRLPTIPKHLPSTSNPFSHKIKNPGQFDLS